MKEAVLNRFFGGRVKPATDERERFFGGRIKVKKTATSVKEAERLSTAKRQVSEAATLRKKAEHEVGQGRVKVGFKVGFKFR